MNVKTATGIILAACFLALPAAAGAQTHTDCATIHLVVSTNHPASFKEACSGTLIVNARIDGKVPYDSEGFGRHNAGLIEYGYGASVRLYQGGPGKGTVWVRAVTAAPTTQHITIRLTPQTSTY